MNSRENASNYPTENIVFSRWKDYHQIIHLDFQGKHRANGHYFKHPGLFRRIHSFWIGRDPKLLGYATPELTKVKRNTSMVGLLREYNNIEPKSTHTLPTFCRLHTNGKMKNIQTRYFEKSAIGNVTHSNMFWHFSNWCSDFTNWLRRN